MDSCSLEYVASAVQQTAGYNHNTLGLFYVTTRLEFTDESRSFCLGVEEWAEGQHRGVKVWRHWARFSEKVILEPHLKGKVGAFRKRAPGRKGRKQPFQVKGTLWGVAVCEEVF